MSMRMMREEQGLAEALQVAQVEDILGRKFAVSVGGDGSSENPPSVFWGQVLGVKLYSIGHPELLTTIGTFIHRGSWQYQNGEFRGESRGESSAEFRFL